jgi:hypothetical protein
MLRTMIISIWVMVWLISGCAQFNSKEEIVYEEGKLQKFSYLNESQGTVKSKANDSAFMDAVEVLGKVDPAALPQLGDLPRFQKDKKGSARTYTGVIKNATKYNVVVPSLNSGATLSIPAHGFIEYVAYTRTFDLTVFSDGNPFYCLKIKADPKNYQYMCKQYDFIAVIDKPEPVVQEKYRKMKRAIKKPKPCPEGEQGAS